MSSTKLDHFQRLQNRAQEFIEGSRLKDGWCCKWLSVPNLVKFDRAVMVYKIINGLCPDSLKGKLVTRPQISNYSTGNCLHLDIPRQNLEFSKRNSFYCGAQTWNETTFHVKMSSKITSFKKIRGIPAQLASFPKARSLGRHAMSANIISSSAKIFIYFSLYL